MWEFKINVVVDITKNDQCTNDNNQTWLNIQKKDKFQLPSLNAAD